MKMGRIYNNLHIINIRVKYLIEINFISSWNKKGYRIPL